MSKHHSRDTLLAAAVQEATEHGLSGLTYGRVARRMGIADRTIVYYFGTKDILITEIVGAFSTQLQEVLSSAMGEDAQVLGDLARKAWPKLCTPAADEAFAVFFEVAGLAAAGTPPYTHLAERLVQDWIDWLSARIDHPRPEVRMDQAVSLIARLDGVLLLRQIGHRDAAERIAASVLWSAP